jgi:peptidoglycan/xylan/chitin deacetylase (PgdA/CDA1 family)
VRRLRHILVRLLGRPFGYVLAHALRLSGRKVGLALVYHRLGERTGDPERELVPPHDASLFESQVRHLNACYRVVPASELLPAAVSRRRGQRLPVAITFDDDLASHRRLALPILQRVGVPATFFVSGISLDGPFTFWWERLQVAVDRGIDVRSALPAVAGTGAGPGRQGGGGIHTIAATIQAMDAGARDEVSAKLTAALGFDEGDAGLREEDLRALVEGGCEIGFHTLRHDVLPQLDDDALARAMVEGRARIESIVGSQLTTIAYPHGNGDPRVAAAARAAGFEHGFTVSLQAVRPETDPLLMGRVEPIFGAVDWFALQVLRALTKKPPRPPPWDERT